jgi:hypothetical protein
MERPHGCEEVKMAKAAKSGKTVKVGDIVTFHFGWLGNNMRESIDLKREFPAKVERVHKDGSLDLFVDVPEEYARNGWHLERIPHEDDAAKVDQPRLPDRWA